MTPDAQDAAAVLSRHVDAAAAALDTEAGSTSLCSASRLGVAIPGVKYREGAWSALREVARESRPDGDVALYAQAVRHRWKGDLAQHEERGSSADWTAYLSGGVDALDALLGQISSRE